MIIETYEIKNEIRTRAENRLSSLFFPLEYTAFLGAGKTSKLKTRKQGKIKPFPVLSLFTLLPIWDTCTTEHKKQKLCPVRHSKGWTSWIFVFYLAALQTIYKLSSIKIKARFMWLKLLHLGRKPWTSGKIICQRHGSLHHEQADEHDCQMSRVILNDYLLMCTYLIYRRIILFIQCALWLNYNISSPEYISDTEHGH